MITSASNAQVKNVILLNQKAKARREQGLFVVEGRKMFLEAPADWVEKVYVSEQLSKDQGFMEKTKGFSVEIVADSVFAKMSDTQTPQGVLSLVKKPVYQEEDLLKGESPMILVLEDLQDPGNVGTMFRTGEGAGIQGVLLTKNTVDLFNPKVIRSTMGSIYRIPFLYMEDISQIAALLRKNGITSYAAHLNGKNAYDQEDYTKSTAFLIGNEGNGLTDQAAKEADTLIRIPMQGRLESLNAAMAAGILMYECFRQRRVV